MRGSVRKKGATWSYRIELAVVDGKRSQVEKSGFKSRREAEKALNDALYMYNNTGDYIENKKITFSEVYTEFIENEAPATRAYATIVRYKSLYRNHYHERFGAYYMFQINANMIHDFLHEKQLTLSEEFVKGLYKFLKVLFGYAHKRQYTKKDIFTEVTPPPDPRHIGEIRAYTAEELAAMNERLQDTNVIIPFYIALNTGLRESEVFALQWSDVDFENRKIKIHKQLLFQDRKWCFCPLKTRNAYRSVNITDSFCEYLKNLKAKQEDNRLFYDDGWKRNFVTDRLVRNKENYMEITDFINIKVNGEMLTTNSIKFLSRAIKRDLGISFKFHNLRHTYATVLAESGVSARYVQEMLGHSRLEFTLRYYTHITEKMGRSAFQHIPDWYEESLLKHYEDTYFPEHIENAGRASYVERNQEMINKSDFCVVYYDENYLPPRRKNSRRDLFDYQPKSGTAVAYDYAVRKRKNIINLCPNEPV